MNRYTDWELMGSDCPLADFSSGSADRDSLFGDWAGSLQINVEVFFSLDHQNGTLSSSTPSQAVCLICLQKIH